MALLDDIARGDSSRPLAAFLVSRQQRLQNERQLNVDAQRQSNALADLALRERGVELGEQKFDFERGQLEAQNKQNEQRIARIAELAGDHPLGPVAIEQVRAGDLKGAFANLEIIRNPNNIVKEFKRGDQLVTGVFNKQGDLVKEIATGTRTERVLQGQIVNEKKINTEAVQSANESRALRFNLTGTLPEIQDNKQSVGIRGATASGLGGLGTTLFGQDAGNKIAEFIANNDLEQIAQVQTRLQTLRAQIIPIVTGERSSRFSEPEREIANKALGVIDSIKGPADLTRAYPQVIGAMKELTIATLENEYNQAFNSEAVDFPFDLNTREGLIAFGTMLSNAGWDDIEEAKRARDRLIAIQNQ